MNLQKKHNFENDLDKITNKIKMIQIGYSDDNDPD